MSVLSPRAAVTTGSWQSAPHKLRHATSLLQALVEPASDDDEEEQSGSDAGSDSDVALSGSDAEAGICRWAEGGKEGG